MGKNEENFFGIKEAINIIDNNMIYLLCAVSIIAACFYALQVKEVEAECGNKIREIYANQVNIPSMMANSNNSGVIWRTDTNGTEDVTSWYCQISGRCG